MYHAICPSSTRLAGWGGGRPRLTSRKIPVAKLGKNNAVKRSIVVRSVRASAVPEVEVAPLDQSSNIPVLDNIIGNFSSKSDPRDKYKLVLQYASQSGTLAESEKTVENRVMGCTAKVWVRAEMDGEGCVQFAGTSDSDLTRGLCGILVQSLSGLKPDQILNFDPQILESLGLGASVMAPSRANGFLNIVETMKKRTRMLIKDLPEFPSLIITADQLTPLGNFAEAQAQYLEPKVDEVKLLAGKLSEKKVGVVAHFYMDPQVQGVLTAASEFWPHIHISDSLVMADRAVQMAEAGCKYIAVLGVDFMSENVRAILDRAGFEDVGLYRMSSDLIGCSLAEAAESDKYLAYLSEAQTVDPSLHVIYINTSLRTKALAHEKVPTITCTSSNVVQTVLQGFAQVPGLTVWYGPDTYMGMNLVQLFQLLAEMSDEEIKALHPAHDRESIRSLLPRLKHFQDGTCIVHHVFGGEVCEIVREAYGDAFLTAHFEVPGEMFTLAMEAKKRGMGVVGSTSNILNFISGVVQDELDNPRSERLQFVLGTEAGMITSIVRKVQGMLRESGNTELEVEIVFPVAPSAITTENQQLDGGKNVSLPGGLSVVPGAASGEGCSLEGGCANCPYMKMNTLHALHHVLDRVGSPETELSIFGYKPKAYTESVGSKSIAEAGCEPIVHMRGFQKLGKLSEELVEDIMSRNK